MDIPANAIPALTSAVLAKSGEFARRMRGHMPPILCDVGHYTNEAFLLRSFVSLQIDVHCGELAMSVDITARRKSDASTIVSIESDLCLNNGTIVATGPSAEFDASRPEFGREIASWEKEFDAFLTRSEAEAIDVLRRMVSGANTASRTKSKNY